MVICFEISGKTKNELNQLLQSGDFSDYSEVVAVAVANQLVLQKRVSNGESMIMGEGAGPPGRSSRSIGAIQSRGPELRNSQETPPPPNRKAAVPSFFLRDVVAESNIKPIAPPGDVFVVGQEVPVDRWIFGQHNKLFTVKASCRGLATLLYSTPKGVALVKAAAEIPEQASELGDFLRELDERHDYSRDEALATAFPNTGPESQKARLRYSNQFVASVNKDGQLSGLLVDLKLINALGAKKPRISLTNAGLNFTRLSSPILDGDPLAPDICRFSKEEIEFLLDHIGANVPAEIFAFRTILASLVQGNQSPEKLDQVLAGHVSARDGKPFTKAFISTQRSGAISRMVELGLVRRVRKGVRVKYEPTDAGISFLNRQTEKER